MTEGEHLSTRRCRGWLVAWQVPLWLQRFCDKGWIPNMVSALITSGLRRETELTLMWLGGGLLLVGLWLLLITGQIHLACALVFALPLVLLAVYDKESALVWTVVYLML